MSQSPKTREENQLDLVPFTGLQQVCWGSRSEQLCWKCWSAKKHLAFKVHLVLIMRSTGKRQLSPLVLKSLTFYFNKTAIHLERVQIWPEFQIYKCSLTKCEQILVWENPIRDPRYVLELISRNSGALLFFSCALHIWLKTMSKHPGFLPFWFEQWDFFWLWMHCQSDCFSHIACRHLSFCSYCQEKLPHKLSEPNEYNFHTSFILEKEKKRH